MSMEKNLSNQNGFLCGCESVLCFEAVEVYAGGELSSPIVEAVPGYGVHTGYLLLVHKGSYLLSESVVDGKTYVRSHWKSICDGSTRVEGVGIVLFEGEVSGKTCGLFSSAMSVLIGFFLIAMPLGPSPISSVVTISS